MQVEIKKITHFPSFTSFFLRFLNFLQQAQLCKLKADPENLGTRINPRNKKERETGLEPAASTLARSRSTN